MTDSNITMTDSTVSNILTELLKQQEILNIAIEQDLKNIPINNPQFKHLAVIEGQKQFVEEICKKCISEKSSIITNLHNNFNKIVIINNMNRDIEVTYNNEQSKQRLPNNEVYYYKFSKKQYFENKTFLYNLRQELQKDFPDAWINTFPGREENTYCVNFMLKRN
jgi:hypothetical protein